MTVILAAAGGAIGGVVVGLHCGWKFHRAWWRDRSHIRCPECGEFKIKSPSQLPPIDPDIDTPPEGL